MGTVTEMGTNVPEVGMERTRCEVWSRVMGYHRPVDQWNQGKQQEHTDRTHFKEMLEWK